MDPPEETPTPTSEATPTPSPEETPAPTITIPEKVTINGITYQVTSIVDSAFAGNKKMTKLTIGSNIKTIGKKAFYKCAKLETVKLGKNVSME